MLMAWSFDARYNPALPGHTHRTALLTALVQSAARLRMFDDQQTARLPPVARLALTTSGIADVRSADQEGRPMAGTVVFRGVPNQQESASRSASAAVSVGSSIVATQAMWASGRISRASAGR
jgi:hypothetical protein